MKVIFDYESNSIEHDLLESWVIHKAGYMVGPATYVMYQEDGYMHLVNETLLS